jgi:hypothetical protein
LNNEIIKELRIYLELIKTYYIEIYNSEEIKKDKILEKFQLNQENLKLFNSLKESSFNNKLYDYVSEKDPLAENVYVEDNRIYSNVKPIYRDAEYKSFVRAHLFSPTKRVFGKLYPTYWVNVFVIWIMSLFLTITLYFDVLRKIVDGSEIFSRRFSKE